MMKPCDREEALLELDRGIERPGLRRVYRWLAPLLERVLAVRAVNQLYENVRGTPPEDFFGAVLEDLRIRYRFSEQEAARIPTEGPVLVIANHPFGALDGIILGDFLLSLRPDARLLANYLLLRMPELAPLLYPIDPFDRPGVARANARTVRESLTWLEQGHLLATFPAGEVSHYRRDYRRVTDGPWHPVTAKLIRKAEVPVVPVYFPGRNSIPFHLLGVLHPRLRTVLLVRELMARRDSQVFLRVGNPIPPRRLREFETDRDLLDFLRLRTYLIGGSDRRPRGPLSIRPGLPVTRAQRRARRQEAEPDGRSPLVEAPDPARIEAAIARLPEESLLLERKQFRAYVFRGSESAELLLELGRLREWTFREVHEGTGKPYDTDHFDLDYLQLFLWDTRERRIAGAYRLGATDEILPRKRKRGFYTSTLFRYRTAFLERLDPALELGRSFITPTYQRKYTTLSFLWQGIGAYIARNPRYRFLFGPVSINCEYETISKDLIIHFLRGNNFDNLLSGKVKAKSPPGKSRLLRKEEQEALARGLRDIDDVSALVAEIEPDSKGVPTLLRHYVKLNARFLSFNVDADFSDVLDGLMVVDLLEVEPKTFRFFMGNGPAEAYYLHHGVEPEMAAV